MRQTLFTIPAEIAGIPVFGFGWLLAIWAVVATILVVRLVRRQGWSSDTWHYLFTLLVSGGVIAFLMPALMDEVGLRIRGYGVMLLIAITAGVGLSIYRARRVGLDPEIILSLATWLFVAGIVGARLFYVIEYWSEFQQLDRAGRPTGVPDVRKILNITQGGLVVYGSLLAGGLALVVFIRKYRIPGLALSDLIAPGVVLGMGLGRIGCFLNGCCYGGICDQPWAVSFPWGTPPHIHQAEYGLLHLEGLVFDGVGNKPPVLQSVEPGSPAAKHSLKAGDRLVALSGPVKKNIDGVARVEIEPLKVETVNDAVRLLEQLRPGEEVSILVAGDSQPKRWTLASPAPPTRPVHPAQLYSAIDAILLCLFLLAYTPFRRREGELTALVLTIHPISRFMLEIIRTDELAVFNTGLSISQNISLLLLVGAAVLWVYLLSRPRGFAWPGPVVAG